MNSQPFRVCTMKCAFPHIENCDRCFGYGLVAPVDPRVKELVPVTASLAFTLRAEFTPSREATACPVCGGTIFGLGSVAPR